MRLTKENILDKTNYGLDIYAHILRQHYHNETVIRLSERDCGINRNPFNSDKPTLHIRIDKTDKYNALSAEYARHTDTENAIPPGDAFGFAQLHYNQTDDKLLQTIRNDMHLKIDERALLGKFSFFKAPITNTKPYKAITLLDAYNYIAGDYAMERTRLLRTVGEARYARMFKAANFDYCTFSGTFTARSDKALIQHSGLLCLDFDHLHDVEGLFYSLVHDEYFETKLLFRSPSGDGLKWIIPIDIAQATHGEYFAAVSNYISRTYNVSVDKSGKDISRACFLPHDSNAYINF